MVRAVPWIPKLTVAGSQFEDKLADLLPILARFERLHYLALADVCYLDVGVHILTPRHEYQEARIQHMKTANTKVAEMVIMACKSLRVLWVGKMAKAIITRYPESGLVDVAWYAEEREDVVDFPYREW
ncbi:hypothetical protein MMC13_002227 [Lambiella insularis]|nr:hypothetical protein [Lambiella insularis]